MKVRAVILVPMALVVAVLVVKAAFVAAYVPRQPERAAALWPGHPDVIFANGLEQVGQLAASGNAVDEVVVDQLLAGAAKAPLAPEPYLVRALVAQIAGNRELAGRALIEARRRDPRSVAARDFLADHFLRAGQTRQGLAEVSALARLVPQSVGGIAPYLAAYARSPGGALEVKAMFRDHPELEPLLLNELAADAGNDRLALYLWSGRGGETARAWQERRLNSLVQSGRYAQAQSAWSRFNPAPKRQGELIEPGFEGRAPSPFGWTFASGPAGVAEPEGGGRLHIIYYGRDDLVLAQQLLMLSPGFHRLSMRVSGSSPTAKSLAWTMRCMPSSEEIGKLGLAGVKNGVLVKSFNVPPAGCGAQRLELAGGAPELPEHVDIAITDLRLEKGPAR